MRSRGRTKRKENRAARGCAAPLRGLGRWGSGTQGFARHSRCTLGFIAAPPSGAKEGRRKERARGGGRALAFTLIELLIVVAIIAILAAIAVPNFLEAQTRAKVSRVRADLRSIATAIEAYFVDSNDYPPNDGVYNVIPIELTTPVAFISSSKLVDPFSEKLSDATFGLLATYYTYQRILPIAEVPAAVMAGRPPATEAIDGPGNPGALEKYGLWKMVSNGPDEKYSDVSFAGTDPVLLGSDILYDPTNGSVSWGNLQRTQKEPEGRQTSQP